MERSDSERGTALIGAVLLVIILTMLSMVSLNLAAQEIEGLAAAREEAVARNLAEAGSNLAVQWFHDPASIPGGPVSGSFAKRYDLPETGPSFFDATGRSQFTGTEDRPDLLYDVANQSDDRLLNDPANGWFRSLNSIGRVLKLKVYGPTNPGLLCTVDVTAGTKTMKRTLSVQLGVMELPPIRAGIQIGHNAPSPVTDEPLPIWVHWGDLTVAGDVRLETPQEIPVKTELAPVTGQSYAEMARREDRWLNVFVGGAAIFAPSPMPVPVPSNVYAHQNPAPGIKLDRWDYETLKRAALLHGAYYVRGQDGLLYRHGRVEPGLGLAVGEVVRSEAPGDHQGLVFIDTLDQSPPRADNLGALVMNTDYAEGLFVINANVVLKPTGTGKSVPALSPPPEGSSSLGGRIPIELTGIHLRGALVTPGDVSFEGQPRIHGALVVGGGIRSSGSAGHLEVWYDHDLRSRLIRGLPLVYLAPGTWKEKY